jgi:hypothetical protein
LRLDDWQVWELEPLEPLEPPELPFEPPELPLEPPELPLEPLGLPLEEPLPSSLLLQPDAANEVRRRAARTMRDFMNVPWSGRLPARARDRRQDGARPGLSQRNRALGRRGPGLCQAVPQARTVPARLP